MTALVHPDSLWAATARPEPDCPPLPGAAKADVCVVGCGFAGLSATLHLAEAGTDVVAIDAGPVGYGASGRNGGQVIPGLKLDPDGIERHFGADWGPRVVAMAGGAPA